LIYLDSVKRSYVIVTDTIAGNSIIGRGFRYHWEYDTTNTTTTITKVQKPRAKVLVGVSVMGTQEDPLFGAGVSLGLQTKKNKLFLVSVSKIYGMKEPVYEATYLVPITFRKKK
jgi:hypothetical protein